MSKRLILGTAGFGGVGSSRRLVGRGESEEASHRILDRAFELGIRALDTAVTYGDGASERFLGSWLRAGGARRRNEVVINTKVGIRGGLSKKSVTDAVDASLRRLGTDRIDTLSAHIPDPHEPWPSVLETFAELATLGKIRTAGVSNVSGDEIAALGVLVSGEGVRFASVQNKYNLLHRSDERSGLLATCRRLGIRYFAYSPLAGGLLSGKYDLAAALPRESRAALRPDIYQDTAIKPHAPAVERLGVLAKDLGVSIPTLALGWLLARSDLDGVILGPRTPDHVTVAEDALRLEIPVAIRNEIDLLF